MVNMDPLFFSSVKEEDDTKPMNPNDLLLSVSQFIHAIIYTNNVPVYRKYEFF